MNVSALQVLLHDQPIGVIFLYGEWQKGGEVRFVADESYADMVDAPTLSLSFDPEQSANRSALWRRRSDWRFNGQVDKEGRSRLPCFFQNMLPEGVFARHVAHKADKDVDDHFHLIAACGADLPGAVRLAPYELDQNRIDYLIGNRVDPVGYTILDDPIAGALSLSGVQPKLGLIRAGDRFVGRTKALGRHVIAKLPVVDYPGLPALEHLSLQLAAAAGVTTCVVTLEPIALLHEDHGYDLGAEANTGHFLCVERYDRDGGPNHDQRIHCEDFAQILDRYPTRKYQGCYAEIATVMMGYPTLGEEAVYELMRRMIVSDLLGNTDMHLKNVSIIYLDGSSPELAPAYDIVAYSVYYGRTGMALPLFPANEASKGAVRTVVVDGRLPNAYEGLRSHNLIEWAETLGLPIARCRQVMRQVLRAVGRHWKNVIDASQITEMQKDRLRHFIKQHPLLTVRQRSSTDLPLE